MEGYYLFCFVFFQKKVILKRIIGVGAKVLFRSKHKGNICTLFERVRLNIVVKNFSRHKTIKNFVEERSHGFVSEGKL